MERYTIDRLEGEYAILESAAVAFEEHLLTELPDGAKQGDCLVFENGEWRIDVEETELRRQRIRSLMDKVFVR